MSTVEDAKRRILTHVPLATLLGETITLQNRSGRKVGLCPFHEEKSPSFTVYDTNYFCFGCRAHGDAIDFVRHQQGIGFIEALRYLAQKYSIDASELDESSGQQQQRQAHTQLLRAMSAAQEFFAENLGHAEGHHAREYLLRRGFSEDNIRAFNFGLAPNEPSQLFHALRQQGFPADDLELISLVGRDGNRFYDFFRDRVMIPIRDPQGRIIAFGGRTLGDHPAKYKNSRETPLFDKSATLYGLDRARAPIRQARRAIVVEGYMDTLQLWQNDICEATACMGTALTPKHLLQLSHVTNLVVLVFDGDSAGQKASLRSVEVALTHPGVAIRVVVLPQGHDPDSFVRAEGKDAFQALVERGQDLLDFAIGNKLANSQGLAVPELVAAELLPWLAKISNGMHRAFLLTRISHLSGISARDLESGLRGLRQPLSAPHLHPAPMGGMQSIRSTLDPLSPVAFDCLGHLYYAQPGELDAKEIKEFITHELSLDERWQVFAEELLTCLQEGLPAFARGAGALTTTLDPEVARLVERFETAKGAFVCTDRRAMVSKLLIAQKEKRLRRAVTELRTRLSVVATQTESREEVPQILTAIQSINKELGTIEILKKS